MAKQVHLCRMQNSIKKLVKYLLQGVLVIAPIAVTLYLIYWLFTSIDELVPLFTTRDAFGRIIYHNKGLGFLIVISALIITGYLSNNFITGRLFKFFDKQLEKVPGIKLVYSTVKDFLEGFAGNKRKFTKPVRVMMRRDPEIWQIGFITQEDLSKISETPLIAVYMPHSYAVSGVTVFVKAENIEHITGIEAADVMKMAISGGVAGYDEQQEIIEIKE
jgi:uncharacterized membrane protein